MVGDGGERPALPRSCTRARPSPAPKGRVGCPAAMGERVLQGCCSWTLALSPPRLLRARPVPTAPLPPPRHPASRSAPTSCSQYYSRTSYWAKTCSWGREVWGSH